MVAREHSGVKRPEENSYPKISTLSRIRFDTITKAVVWIDVDPVTVSARLRSPHCADNTGTVWVRTDVSMTIGQSINQSFISKTH